MSFIDFFSVVRIRTCVIIFTFALAACGGGSGGGSTGNTDDAGSNIDEYSSANITTSGGSYLLENGVLFEVPAGAVNENMEIRVRLLGATEVQSILDNQQSSNTIEFIAGVEIEPKGYTFLKPVTLSIPADKSVSPTALPMLLIVDIANKIYTIDPSFISSPSLPKTSLNASVSTSLAVASPYIATKYIHADCENNRFVFVNLDSLPEGERRMVIASYKDMRDDLGEACKACNFDIRVEAFDYIQEGPLGACYNIASKGTVIYHDCPEPNTETWDLHEKSVGQVMLIPAAIRLGPGDSATIDSFVLDADGNEMDFYSIQSLSSSDKAVATAEKHNSEPNRFQVTAGQPGTATITETVQCNIQATLPVDVLDFAVTPGNLCVDKGQIAKFSVIRSDAVDLSEMSWTSSDTTVATVDSTGLVVSTGLGPAQITASILTDAGEFSATANVEVKENCVSIRAPESGLGASCIEASPTIEPLDNTTDLEITINTPLEGYGLFWESSDTQVATVERNGQLTSSVTARSSGPADIQVTVDNIVTQYNATIPVTVKNLPDDYKSAWLTVLGDQIVTLTDNRDILAEPQLVDFVLEAEARCNVDLDPAGLGLTEYTDFNLSGQIIGHREDLISGIRGFIFDTKTCIVDILVARRPVGMPIGTLSNYRRTYPLAINEEGTVVGYVEWVSYNESESESRSWTYSVHTAFIYELGKFSFPLLTTIDPSNVVTPKSEFIDINNNRVALTSEWAGYSLYLDYLYKIDNPMGSVPIDSDFLEVEAINDYERVVSGYPQMFANGSIFSIPLVFSGVTATHPILYDINNADDILAEDHFFTPVTDDSYDPAINRKYFVNYLCPFPVESGTALWIEDPGQLEGYEELEISCDGRDNDLDGFIDVPLVDPFTTKQAGVCAGKVKKCKGQGGWVDDYSSISTYEFPEVSCDGLDNDCDGITDEGCS